MPAASSLNDMSSVTGLTWGKDRTDFHELSFDPCARTRMRTHTQIQEKVKTTTTTKRHCGLKSSFGRNISRSMSLYLSLQAIGPSSSTFIYLLEKAVGALRCSSLNTMYLLNLTEKIQALC